MNSTPQIQREKEITRKLPESVSEEVPLKRHATTPKINQSMPPPTPQFSLSKDRLSL